MLLVQTNCSHIKMDCDRLSVRCWTRCLLCRVRLKPWLPNGWIMLKFTLHLQAKKLVDIDKPLL